MSAGRLPTRIPCEGTGWPPAGGVLCAMCGRAGLVANGFVVAHQRDDILAMIERGDFG